MDRIRELKNHSYRIGSNPDLVQASGGNASWKENKVIWIKGSGKKLKDAHVEEIFACLNYEKLSYSKALECHDFSRFSTNGIAPSIETNFHILISNRFVTHLHSLGSIALGVSDQINMKLNLEAEVSFVPYARPGVDLAKAINGVRDCSNKVLVLRNHGVIFSGNEFSDIEEKITGFERTIRDLFHQIPESKSYPSWIDIVTSGVMTPDEAVFLGPKPFVKSEVPLTNSVGINSHGELLFPVGFSSDRTDLAKFYMRVAKLIERKTQVNYLPEKEVHELLNWDKEQIRIAMAK